MNRNPIILLWAFFFISHLKNESNTSTINPISFRLLLFIKYCQSQSQSQSPSTALNMKWSQMTVLFSPISYENSPSAISDPVWPLSMITWQHWINVGKMRVCRRSNTCCATSTRTNHHMWCCRPLTPSPLMKLTLKSRWQILTPSWEREMKIWTMISSLIPWLGDLQTDSFHLSAKISVYEYECPARLLLGSNEETDWLNNDFREHVDFTVSINTQKVLRLFANNIIICQPYEATLSWILREQAVLWLCTSKLCW